MAYTIREHRQTEVDIEVIRRTGETVVLQDIERGYAGAAVDVYDEKGHIVGSLIYVPVCGVRDLKE